MIKNLVVGATLIALYQFLKKDWKDTDLYKAGVIDADGNRIEVQSKSVEYQEADSRFARFAAGIKRILQNAPLLKLQFMRTMLNAITMREAFDGYRFVDTKYGLGIIVEHDQINESVLVLHTEQGTVYLMEDDVTNVVSGVDTSPSKGQLFGKAMRRRNCPQANEVIKGALRRLKRRKNRKEARRMSDQEALLLGTPSAKAKTGDE